MILPHNLLECGTQNAPKATGLTVERHYTGGLQCLIMHRRRVKGTLFAVQEVWVAATTHNRRETACICRLAVARDGGGFNSEVRL